MSRSFPIGFAGARMELHIPGHRRGVVPAGAGPQLEPRASQRARGIDDISHVRQSARLPLSQSRPLAPGSPAESLQRVSAQPPHPQTQTRGRAPQHEGGAFQAYRRSGPRQYGLRIHQPPRPDTVALSHSCGNSTTCRPWRPSYTRVSSWVMEPLRESWPPPAR
jgi:hypothetical protein